MTAAPRHTADSITDDALDHLYAERDRLRERLERRTRAIERGYALCEEWEDDPGPITRREAADRLGEVLNTASDTWVQRDAPPPRRLRALPAPDTEEPDRG